VVALGGAINVPEIKNWRTPKFVPQLPEAKRNE
jgi:hypothetical protein